MSSDNDIVLLIIYSPYICLEILRMMIDYYRQNEMRTKNCYKNCVTFIIAI
ncbi:hypothetical protein HmCmsJML281_03718 [Escherichia coli]|nr:hypothetical protein HmCmsJML281_03718 [Escherichia coli]